MALELLVAAAAHILFFFFLNSKFPLSRSEWSVALLVVSPVSLAVESTEFCLVVVVGVVVFIPPFDV